MTDHSRAGAHPIRGAVESGSGATVTTTLRAAFSYPVLDPALPATPASPAWCAADEAANGGRHDHDLGTRWEGLIHELPRFRSHPISRATHSGRHREVEPVTTPAVEKAKRRNARKARKGGGHGGYAGLLAAIVAAA